MPTLPLIKNGCDKGRRTPNTQHMNTQIEPKPKKQKFVSRQKTKKHKF